MSIALQHTEISNLRAARKDKRLSQKEVALRLGLDQTSISKFELGVIRPSAATMEKISELYGKPIGWLFFNQR